MNMNFDMSKLKECIKELNGNKELLEAIGEEPIKTVAVKKEVLAEKYLSLVEKIDDHPDFSSSITDEMKTMYNEILGEEDDGDDAASKEPEKKEPEKKEAKGKGKKDPEPEKKEADKKETGKKETGKKSSEKKDDQPKKERKAPNADEPRSPYGHLMSAASGRIDAVLVEGPATYEDIMKAADVERGRVKSHIKALKNKGLTVTEKVDDKDWKKTVVTVKEKKLN